MNTFVLSLLKVTCLFLSCPVFPAVPPPPAWLLLSCGFYLGPSGCPKIPFMRFCFEITTLRYDYGFVPVRVQSVVKILVHDLIPPRSVPLELQWRWSRVSSSFTQTWEQQTFASHVRGKKEAIPIWQLSKEAGNYQTIPTFSATWTRARVEGDPRHRSKRNCVYVKLHLLAPKWRDGSVPVKIAE